MFWDELNSISSSINLRDVFKMLCDVETDYDVLKCFLDHEPSLHRSKYIRNYLQENPNCMSDK